MNHRLEGGCQVPIGGFATLENEMVHLKGLVASLDGSQVLRVSASDKVENAEQLGIQVAEELLEKGADKILDAVYKQAQ